MAAVDRVRTSYLGYPLLVEDAQLTILTPAGRKLYAGPFTVSTARRIIRGHRRATPQEARS